MAIEIVNFPIKNGGSFHSHVKLPEGSWYTNPYHGQWKACNSCSFHCSFIPLLACFLVQKPRKPSHHSVFCPKKPKTSQPNDMGMSKNVNKKTAVYQDVVYSKNPPNCLSPSFGFGKAPWLGESPSNGSIMFPLKPPWQKWMGPPVEFAWTVGWKKWFNNSMVYGRYNSPR